jgi:hypothetical protein
MVDLSVQGALNTIGVGNINLSSVMGGIGWLILGIIIVGGVGFGAYVYLERKKFGKRTTDFEVINGTYTPTVRDVARLVKIGKGGFQLLYLKKLKTWRIAWGGRIGRNDYYFFIGQDQYPYNAMLSADIHAIDKEGGFIPIVVTNPLMRAQYTALEKQIDALHGEKKTFMEKYGMWVLSIGFVLIIGVMMWLIFREVPSVLGRLEMLVDKVNTLLDRSVSILQEAKGGSGLIPAS